jgi:hypothetical protein
MKEVTLRFPIVSAVTGEFTPEFLAWWPYRGLPHCMDNVEPYATHRKEAIGLVHVFRPERGKIVIPIIPYCGFYQARICATGEYREWVREMIKSLDKIRRS